MPSSRIPDQEFMAKFSMAGKEDLGEMEGTKVADLLLLLSCNGGKDQDVSGVNKPMGREYECKTCNRRFPTFQALGGHRTSHMRPRVRRDRVEQGEKERSKPRVHECPVCGLEFPMGQALGGHMRRHNPTEAGAARTEEKAGAGKVFWLDLNLTPLENDLELTTLGLGLGSHRGGSCD